MNISEITDRGRAVNVVIATVALLAFEVYTGEVSTVVEGIIWFVIYLIALYVGFTIMDAVWYRVFDSTENQ